MDATARLRRQRSLANLHGQRVRSHNVYGPGSSGRDRKSTTASSSSRAITLT